MVMPNPPDAVSLFSYRLDTIAKEVEQIKTSMANYVSVRENELMLQTLQATVARIETNVGLLTDKLDKLQLRILSSVITTIISVITLIFVAWITHFFK